MRIIAIDLGGTRIKIGLVKMGEIQHLTIKKVSSANGLKPHLAFIKEKIRNIIQMEDRIQGVVIAFPGLVNTTNNTIIDTSAKYDDTPEINLAAWIRTETGLELRMENDARLACLGEWQFGAGRNYSDMVMCTLGTGIGSSAIMDNKIVRGKHFQAGVLGGHFLIDFNNKLNRCSCGNFGCVEALASNWMIKNLAETHPLYHESSLYKVDEIDLALVFKLSKAGDKLSALLQEHCLTAWAAGMVNLIHAYDPEIVVVGGGVMHSKEVIIPFFRSYIAGHAWCPSGTPTIVAAKHPDTAALLGAYFLFEEHKRNEQLLS